MDKTNRVDNIPMEPEDLRLLRKKFIPLIVIAFFAVGLFFFIFTFILKDLNFGGAGDIIPLVIFGVFAAFFAGIIGYMFFSMFADLRAGVKYQVNGTVTDRRIDIRKSSSTRSSGRGGATRSSSSTTRYYYVSVDGKEYKMDYPEYNKVKTGDVIMFQKTPRAAITLKLEVLESGLETVPEQAREKTSDFLETYLEEVALRAEDYAALKKQYFAFLRRRLMWMAVPGFIVFSMLASDLAALLIFLFPLVIILGVQFFLLIKGTIAYQKNKGYGKKRAKTAVVTDKLTITGNQRKTQQKLGTTAGYLTVPSEVYEHLAVNDKFIFFMPLRGKAPLSILTMDQQEFFM